MRAFMTLVLICGLALASPAAGAPRASRAVLIVLDGGGDRIIGRLLDAGRMPHLQALIARGVRARSLWPPSPADAASCHAALWTGAMSDANGVSGDRRPLLPRSRHTLLEVESGAEATSLDLEPFWTTAAKAGKRVTVLQASHLEPITAYGPEGPWGGAVAARLMLHDGAASCGEDEEVLTSTASLRPAIGWSELPQSGLPPLELPLRAGNTPLFGLIYDDPRDPVRGYDTMQLRTRRESAQGAQILKPGLDEADSLGKFSFPVHVEVASVSYQAVYRLFELAPEASSLRLYRSALADERSNQPERLASWQARVGCPVPQGAERAYAKGLLGLTLAEGGSGEAEDRLLETIRLSLASRTERFRVAARQDAWDLLVDELPYPDDVLHLWYGLLDERSPGYLPRVGPLLWLRVEAVARMLDDYLGAVQEALGDGAAEIVVGDHGMDGVQLDLYPNVLLKRAGLMAVDVRGRVDLARTRAIYAPGNGGYVAVNSTDHAGGIVPPDQVEGVVTQVIQVLRRARDSRTRKRLIAGMYLTRAAEPRAGLGGSSGGELYLDPAPGIALQPEWAGDQPLRRHPAWRTGEHGFVGLRPSMQGVCYLAGPGVRRGIVVDAVRACDVAPTLLRLLGLNPAAGMTGHVIEGALDP